MSTAAVAQTMSMWSKPFWQGAGERAIKTFAQTFLASFGVGSAADISVPSLDGNVWLLALVSSLAAAGLSVVMSVASPGFTAGEAALVAASTPYAPLPEAVMVQDGDGEHRAEADPDPAEDANSDLIR